jgi:hypothetical protein
MRLAIMQPYLFPYIGYFQLINAVDKFIIYDDVNYINKGWINRNNILINGKANLINIPLKQASQNKLIKEVEIFEDSKWKKTFLKTIEINYKKARFFSEIFKLIADCFEMPCKTIAELNFNTLKLSCLYLGITTELIETSSIYNNETLKGQHRILDICLQEGASHYINPIGGIDIYSKELFCENNILLNFIKPQPIYYKQFQHEFLPWLSIMDVMMFNSPEEIKNILNQYELI